MTLESDCLKPSCEERHWTTHFNYSVPHFPHLSHGSGHTFSQEQGLVELINACVSSLDSAVSYLKFTARVNPELALGVASSPRSPC